MSRRSLLVWLLVWLAWCRAIERFAAGVEASCSRPARIARSLRIDVNRAPVARLMLLPGIGRGRAEALVLWRVRYGRFRSLEELTAVPGIGADTLRRFRRFATCRG